MTIRHAHPGKFRPYPGGHFTHGGGRLDDRQASAIETNATALRDGALPGLYYSTAMRGCLGRNLCPGLAGASPRCQ
ncbi:hypothetical protein ACU4GD_26855 [Cupriavidus basilensis]